ncbi:2-hydroxy-3-oxopropionate reductase [Caproiciproducens faecalis]|uniref:2-hydroxy-3-oxopropionate reductase n=1 Tax=Caproiciproducens faecalis TaxID=2820301 RepID=A0ABS7DJ84_9FIRM|nr:2-hydroxy-3-oxopropionate reductase [Caproiciproducens faecalis]MBW7571338.1 2-hydroxy-3-oxopropionate reductase [Caproiciproducens faecalis]
MKVGFIGLGIMGKPMAKNLVKAGYSLIVSNLTEGPVNELVAMGAQKAGSPSEIARQCDVILTMLPNSPQVEEVALGKNGLIESMKLGSVLIDMSSINPMASKEISAELAKKGIQMLDAPVSGGEPKAVDGTLAFMVGGEREVFDRFEELLSKMGSSVVYCGGIGAGNVTKLSNQIIVAVNIAAVSEAFMLAKRTGVSPETVFNAIKGGLAGSTVMNAKAPMMISGNFDPGFRIDLHIKDLNNALATGHSVGSPLLLTAEVMEMLQTLHADGHGSEDHSAIVRYYEKIAGETIR